MRVQCTFHRVTKLTDAARAKLQRPNFGYLAVDANGPHVSPIWVDTDGEYVIVNEAIGRVKERAMHDGARVALSIAEHDDPYDHVDIRGRVVRLAAVEGEDGRFARQLGRFLRNRDVVCEPAQSPDRHRCKVEGHDLSTLVLLNGGGRATSDAPPELLSAEDEARLARLGVWRRWR